MAKEPFETETEGCRMCLAETRYVPFFRAATHDLVRLTGSSIAAALSTELRRMLKRTALQ